MNFRLGGTSQSSAVVSRPLDERTRSVSYAAMAYWYYRWDWGEAVALDGMVAAAPVDELIGAWVDRELDSWVIRCIDGGEAVSPLGPAWAVVRRLREGQWDLADKAIELLKLLTQAVVSAARDSGAFTPERDGSYVYVDSLYGLPVALAEYAMHLDDDNLLTQVGVLTEHHIDLLQDRETGLFAHYASSDTGDGPAIWWGRGNGWAALGLADLLAAVGPDRFPFLPERLDLLLSGLRQFQCPSGEWRNLIAEPHSYPEASTTALVSAALAIAQDQGISIDVLSASQRGWAAVADRIDTNGHLYGVSYRPGINTDPSRYEHAPAVGSYPWGQGAWLRAAAATA